MEVFYLTFWLLHGSKWDSTDLCQLVCSEESFERVPGPGQGFERNCHWCCHNLSLTHSQSLPDPHLYAGIVYAHWWLICATPLVPHDFLAALGTVPHGPCGMPVYYKNRIRPLGTQGLEFSGKAHTLCADCPRVNPWHLPGWVGKNTEAR